MLAHGAPRIRRLLCAEWEACGRCQLGDRCANAHGLCQLTPMPEHFKSLACTEAECAEFRCERLHAGEWILRMATTPETRPHGEVLLDARFDTVYVRDL